MSTTLVRNGTIVTASDRYQQPSLFTLLAEDHPVEQKN